ncbi:MAG: hypothetical protein M5U28_50630 [Sandaracinaceae bacterium]|nr:hypothetical protein [Sandaracinaceae bacterium]
MTAPVSAPRIVASPASASSCARSASAVAAFVSNSGASQVAGGSTVHMPVLGSPQPAHTPRIDPNKAMLFFTTAPPQPSSGPP